VQTRQPIFSPPIRWTLGVLSWLAFGIAAYLAVTNFANSSVAGCVVGSHQGCDAVLNSAWSKWLGIPVALLGANCYAALAGLSLLLIVQPNQNRWVTTAWILLATLAAGASLWFIALQVIVIGEFCMYCLATDLCGIAIGAITAWSVYRWWSGAPQVRAGGSSSASLSALRSAIPSNPRVAPAAATRAAPPTDSAEAAPAAPRTPTTSIARSVPLVGSVASRGAVRTFAPPPSLPIAYGGALAFLVLLIAGQIVLPAKTYELQQVALKDQVDLSNGGANGSNTSDDAATHVANRIPPDGDASAADQQSNPSATPENGNGPTAGDKTPGDDSAATATPEPRRERKIKLLGGKLTIDVGDEPLIGSIDAPHIVVEMISYDCPHCRKTNKIMKRALARYGDQVALVVLPLPLESKCNRLVTHPDASHSGACATARTVLAVAKVRPQSFPKFHEFVMSGDEKKPPALTSILIKAYGLADHGKLKEASDSKQVADKIASYVNLFEMLQKNNAESKEKFGLPIQILGDHVMSGTVEKADDVYKAWEEHLGVKPR
jgi:uncharacterized membrane protein